MIVLLALPLLIQAQGLPPAEPTANSGDIRIAGVSSLVPLTETLAASYRQDGFTGSITVTAENPNTSFASFCSGAIDIVLSGQQPSPVDTDNCAAAGRSLISFRVATDAVAVATSLSNNFVDSLTTAELQQIFGTALSWSNVRQTWPGDPIGIVGPGTTSPEFALFAALVFGGDTRTLSTALGAQFNADPNISLQNLQTSPTTIGFFSADFVDRNAAALKIIPVGGVGPTTTNISELIYPLSRPLFLFTSASVLQEQPQVADFVNYYLANAPQQIPTTALYPVPQGAQNAASAAWFEAVGDAPEEEAPPTAAPTLEAATQVVPEETEIPDPLVEEEPTQAAVNFETGVLPILINARTDLEVLATEALGAGRPVGWSGSLDINDPQLALLLRLDLEIMAGTLLGAENRPEGWFGAVSGSQFALARDIRHDLELLADSVFGSPIARPASWLGGEPLFRCSRSTQTLVSVVQAQGYELEADPDSSTYCQDVEIEASQYADSSLQPASAQTAASAGIAAPAAAAVTIDSEFAVGFGNRNASVRFGVVPFGEAVTPVARSYTQFSNMTLVEGNGFRVFVDWRDTTLTEAEFDALPDEASAALQTFCDAAWCE
jgi:phosphate transport system substrate-binding protein